jgi:hypothetical protein
VHARIEAEEKSLEAEERLSLGETAYPVNLCYGIDAGSDRSGETVVRECNPLAVGLDSSTKERKEEGKKEGRKAIRKERMKERTKEGRKDRREVAVQKSVTACNWSHHYLSIYRTYSPPGRSTVLPFYL